MANRSLFAGPSTPTVETVNGVPLGLETVAVGAAAVGLPNIPAGAVYALIISTGGNVNWRDDGVAPTAAIGMPMIVGQPPIKLTNLAALQFIEQAGAATLNVSFYR